MKRTDYLKYWLARVTAVTFVVTISSMITTAQTRTFSNTTGFWDVAGNWTNGEIADDVAEDVAFSNGANKTATVRAGTTYTVGNIDLSGNGDIVVQATGILNVGAAGTPKGISAVNGALILVLGRLEIWGDLNVKNSLTWNVGDGGVVIIHGNVIMDQNASLTVTGDIQINGNFTAGQNTNVTINAGGELAVGGDIVVGGGTTSMSNNGTFSASSCTGPAGFCNTVILPVTLIYFSGSSENGEVVLSWATATEINFEKFVIEKTLDAKTFTEIGSLAGAGTSFERRDYVFKDPYPTLGKAYYRLKTVDFDGYTEYFGMVMVEVKGQKGIFVYPNPTTSDQVGVELNFDPGANTHVVLLDLFGLQHGKYQIVTQFQHYDFGQLKPGTYIVRVISEGVFSQSKIVIK